MCVEENNLREKNIAVSQKAGTNLMPCENGVEPELKQSKKFDTKFFNH